MVKRCQYQDFFLKESKSKPMQKAHHFLSILWFSKFWAHLFHPPCCLLSLGRAKQLIYLKTGGGQFSDLTRKHDAGIWASGWAESSAAARHHADSSACLPVARTLWGLEAVVLGSWPTFSSGTGLLLRLGNLQQLDLDEVAQPTTATAACFSCSQPLLKASAGSNRDILLHFDSLMESWTPNLPTPAQLQFLAWGAEGCRAKHSALFGWPRDQQTSSCTQIGRAHSFGHPAAPGGRASWCQPLAPSSHAVGPSWAPQSSRGWWQLTPAPWAEAPSLVALMSDLHPLTLCQGPDAEQGHRGYAVILPLPPQLECKGSPRIQSCQQDQQVHHWDAAKEHPCSGKHCSGGGGYWKVP